MKFKGSLTDPGFVSRIMQYFTRRPRLEDGETARPFGSTTTSYGGDVSADTALKQSAWWACVDLRSKVLASLPLHVMNADKTTASGHPLYDLLHTSPNADMTTMDYLRASVCGLDMWGNGYSRLFWSDARDRLVAMEPLNPEKVSVSRGVSGGLRYEYQRAARDPLVLDERDVLHFKGFTLDGLTGLSPIQYAALTVGGVAAANEAAAREFANGMKAGGFLTLPENVLLDPDQRKKYRNLLAEFGLPENAGKFLLLEHGITVGAAKEIRFNPVDAQLIESRYFGIEEICRAHGVPPPLIGHTDKASSWASSVENLNQFFLTYCLRPTMVSMEMAMKKKLVPRAEWKAVNIAFNFRGLLRGNFTTQMASYVQALNNGLHNIDEVRDLEDYPPLPDDLGQEYRVPMNTQPVGTPPKQEEPPANQPEDPAVPPVRLVQRR